MPMLGIKSAIQEIETYKTICQNILFMFKPEYKEGEYDIIGMYIDERPNQEDQVVIDLETYRHGGDYSSESIPVSWVELYTSGNEEELKIKIAETIERIKSAQKAKQERLAKETAELNEQRDREALDRLIKKFGIQIKE